MRENRDGLHFLQLLRLLHAKDGLNAVVDEMALILLAHADISPSGTCSVGWARAREAATSGTRLELEAY